MPPSPSQPLPQPAPRPLPLQLVAEATGRFVARVHAHAPSRVEARIASPDGMPLLCAVEAVLGRALPRPTAQELVWLSDAPASGGHVLRLQTFGGDNSLLAEATHEFSS